jgi:hypothetical protein
MGLLRWISGEMSENTLSRAELALLSQYQKPRGLTPGGVTVLWRGALGAEPAEVAARFVRQGLIVVAPLHMQIESRMSAVQMKKLIESRGLKASGRKADLAQRLSDTAPADFVSSLPGETIWICSEVGRALIEPYLKREASQKNEAQRKARDYLDRGDLEGAARIATAYDASKLFPSVVWVDGSLSGDDPQRLSELLHLLESAVAHPPAILSGFQHHILRKMADLLAWSLLWHEEVSRAQLSMIAVDAEAKPHQAILNFKRWVVSRHTLNSYRRSQAKVKVEILPGPGCDLAEHHRGVAYTLDRCPEIPIAGCKRDPCCACCYAPIVAKTLTSRARS